MNKQVIGLIVIVALAMAIPSSSRIARAKKTTLIRVATLAPRGTSLSTAFKELDIRVRKATKGEYSVLLYPSGVAGDENDVLRKMRVGQMDGTIVSTTGLSQILPEVALLDTPGIINSYKELEAVQAEMKSEWEKMFSDKGYILLAWGETGRYRFFSKTPIYSPSDFHKTRPWLLPNSYVLKEIWRVIGISAIPLGIPEVYGALQTGIIDACTSTSVAFIALRWHTKLKYVTKTTAGVLISSMLVNKKKWDALPEIVKKEFSKIIRDGTKADREAMRQMDDRAYNQLLKRKYIAYDFSEKGQKEFEVIQNKVIRRLTGRIFSPELLNRVQKITARISGSDQKTSI